MNINESFVGKHVIIKRSSGSKQEGWVSKIDHLNKCVLVEWEENAQAKAKEVSFDQLRSWNRELFGVTCAESIDVVPQHTVRNPAQLHQLPQKSAELEDSNKKQRPQLQRALNSRKTTVFSKTSPPLYKRKSLYNAADARDIMQPSSSSNRSSPVKKKVKVQATAPRKSIAAVGAATAQLGEENVKPRYPRVSLSAQRLAALEKNVKVVDICIDGEAEQEIPPNSPHYPFYTMIKDYRETLDLRPIFYDNDDSTSRNLQICVCIRKRPLNQKEVSSKEIDIVTMTSKQQTLVHECRHKVDMTKYLENHDFLFDYCFNETCDNATIYKHTTKPLVDCIFDGGMATCFAYGQTGSGKTYTMGGNYFTDNINGVDEEKGIYDFAAKEIFNKIKHNNGTHVTISVYEIYGTKVLDLLNDKRILRVMEDGQGSVKVCELKEIPVFNEREIRSHIRAALKIRSSGVTSANANSSRSHAIIQFIIYKREDKKTKAMLGKLSLIDLAGNERGADTKTCDRNTRLEGAEINKSLLSLKECIRALGRKNAHLPFRSSKLTQVLKDSFIHEKARTCMIATISPGIGCCENTLNTLHYANRVKQLGSKNSNNAENVSKEDDNRLEMEYVELMDPDEEMEMSPETIDLRKVKEDLIDEHIIAINESDNITDYEKHLVGKVDKMSLQDYVETLDDYVSKKLNLYESLTHKINQVKTALDDIHFNHRR